MLSSVGHPTERVLQFFDCHIQPLVKTTNSFIKDIIHFLTKLEQLEHLPDIAFLVTIDVSSLYINIPHNEARHWCMLTFPQHTSTQRMILTMNNFSFDDKNFLQIHGTATGNKWAPSYANLFLVRFATNALKHAPHKPHIWYSYIGDIFMIIWTHSLEDLDAFTI